MARRVQDPNEPPESCRVARTRLAATPDSLRPEERMELDAHLASCPDCAGLLATADEASRLLAKVEAIDPPERLLSRLRRIPGENFACHRFAAEAAGLLESRDRDEARTPAGAFAAHLAECSACGAAWRVLSLVGTLPEVGPRREAFRRLVLIPSLERRAARGDDRSAWVGIPAWRIATEKVLGDIRWTATAAWMLAVVVMVVAGNPATLARGAASGARSAATSLTRKLPAVSQIDRPNPEIEAARLVAKTRALPVAYGKAYLVAIRNRIFGFSPESSGSRTSPSRAPGAGRRSTALAGHEQRFVG